MPQPLAYEEVEEGLVKRLKKSIYGLKRAEHTWYDALSLTWASAPAMPTRCLLCTGGGLRLNPGSAH
jgi:hypothetical protein